MAEAIAPKKRTDMACAYVSARLNRMREESDSGRGKAELANLRRGIGRTPGDMPENWGTLFDGLPEALMSESGEPTREEWAAYTALTLYALHQQGRSAREEPMHRSDCPLGRSVRRLARSEEDLERVRRRFNAFATADGMEECAHHLRGLVQLMRAEGIPLDYIALTRDLCLFQNPKTARDVRLTWGQDFYRYTEDEQNGEDKRHE